MTFITTTFREAQVWHSHTKSINCHYQADYHSWLIIIFNVYFSMEIQLNAMLLTSNASQFILTAENIHTWTLFWILCNVPQRAKGKEMTFDSFNAKYCPSSLLYIALCTSLSVLVLFDALGPTALLIHCNTLVIFWLHQGTWTPIFQ